MRVANEAALAGLSTAIGTMVFAEAEESLWVNSSAGFVEVAKLGNTGAVSDAALPFLAPVGMVSPFAGASAPSGWLLCDGSALNASTSPQYAALYSVIGVTYGGTNNTDFRVPNLLGRTIVGAGTGARQGESGSGAISGGTNLTARSRGQWFGDERLQGHTHTWSTTGGGHEHTYYRTAQTATSLGYNTGLLRFADTNASLGGDPQGTSGGGSHSHSGTTDNHNQSQGAQQNLQPSLVLNHIIKF